MVQINEANRTNI